MKVLVATKETQGQRESDFCFCDDGEMLVQGLVCAADAHSMDVDSGCGCGRNLDGVLSWKGTTTFEVANLPMTPEQFEQQYVSAFQDAGWTPYVMREDIVRAQAKRMMAIAALFEIGDILEKRSPGLLDGICKRPKAKVIV